MTDTELELAAARVLGLSVLTEEAFGCVYINVDHPELGPPSKCGMPWRPLSDWRDTGKCLEWLRANNDVSLSHDPVSDVSVISVFVQDTSATLRYHGDGDNDQHAIVRAVVAVREGEHA